MKEIIITSSVLILCIIFIRIIFKGKISSRLQYALWLLVTLRLMIPSSAQIHMAIGSIEEFRIMDIVRRYDWTTGETGTVYDVAQHTAWRTGGGIYAGRGFERTGFTGRTDKCFSCGESWITLAGCISRNMDRRDGGNWYMDGNDQYCICA